jgi:hypothetical protein
VQQPIRHMPTIITASNLRFETGNLIGECPAA